MSESKEIIDSLKNKIKSIISLNEDSKEKVSNLELEVRQLKDKLREQESKVVELKSYNNQNQLAEAFIQSVEDPHEARMKINNIVREIDKCIALLNK